MAVPTTFAMGTVVSGGEVTALLLVGRDKHLAQAPFKGLPKCPYHRKPNIIPANENARPSAVDIDNVGVVGHCHAHIILPNIFLAISFLGCIFK